MHPCLPSAAFDTALDVVYLTKRLKADIETAAHIHHPERPEVVRNKVRAFTEDHCRLIMQPTRQRPAMFNVSNLLGPIV